MSSNPLQKQLYEILIANESFDKTKERINILIKEGADIHKPLTTWGNYAFHAISMRIFFNHNIDTEKICDYLLQLNCDINALNNNKYTPLYVLCVGYSDNYEEQHNIIEYLLSINEFIARVL